MFIIPRTNEEMRTDWSRLWIATTSMLQVEAAQGIDHDNFSFVAGSV